ncbi:transcriptional regulator, AsnC family [Rubrimonas cliftonensis]|uniref:Transcriptional regulator, AsnC family n=2 Tax=Rubrimonas cliftonensis TaxID=89524 RepID=A0A1H3W3U4_9RHOB|nr:transcriptional regulator, AsnC family [Rubrimonas cliftonensis]
MTTLDEMDQSLLRFLRRDARTPTAELARRLGVSRTTVQARLEKLERTGVIAGYTIVAGDAVDAGMIRATVLIQVEPRMTASIVAALGRMREVEGLFTTAGRFDMAIQLAAAGTPQLDSALDRIGELDGVRGMESLIHLTAKIDRRR